MSQNAPPITISIDMTKLIKGHFIKGKTGTFCDLILFPSQEQKYGKTHFVVQGVSKEARQAGERGPIVGNAVIPADLRQENNDRRERGFSRPPEKSGPSRYSSPPSSAPATPQSDDDFDF